MKLWTSIRKDIFYQVIDIILFKNSKFILEEISKYFKEEGEPFCQEELEEFLSAAVDPAKGKIFYRDYVALLAVDEAGL